MDYYRFHRHPVSRGEHTPAARGRVVSEPSVRVDRVMVASSDFKHLGSFSSGTYPTQAEGIQPLVNNGAADST